MRRDGWFKDGGGATFVRSRKVEMISTFGRGRHFGGRGGVGGRGFCACAGAGAGGGGGGGGGGGRCCRRHSAYIRPGVRSP